MKSMSDQSTVGEKRKVSDLELESEEPQRQTAPDDLQGEIYSIKIDNIRRIVGDSAQVNHRKPIRTGKHYGSEFKVQIIQKFDNLVKSGVSHTAASKQLGLEIGCNGQTIVNWSDSREQIMEAYLKEETESENSGFHSDSEPLRDGKHLDLELKIQTIQRFDELVKSGIGPTTAANQLGLEIGCRGQTVVNWSAGRKRIFEAHRREIEELEKVPAAPIASKPYSLAFRIQIVQRFDDLLRSGLTRNAASKELGSQIGCHGQTVLNWSDGRSDMVASLLLMQKAEESSRVAAAVTLNNSSGPKGGI